MKENERLNATPKYSLMAMKGNLLNKRLRLYETVWSQKEVHSNAGR
jgi:hypothetical protein